MELEIINLVNKYRKGFNPTIEDIIKLVSIYDKESISLIEKAYNYALKVHGNQKRKSGELYITHPIFVAYILAILKADKDTICACLLHDVIEDGENITKEDIEKEFNKTIAVLVDGVTKEDIKFFPNKDAQNYANTRKMLIGVLIDVRIMLIKLSDRLHNMLTLEHLPRKKQIENSIETLEIYAPFAKKLGIQVIKNILEELAFQNLNSDIYQYISYKKEKYKDTKIDSLEETKNELEKSLISLGISNEINYRFKRNYAIYQNLSINKNILDLNINDIARILNFDNNNIHDLQSLKILVTNLGECYKTLELIQRKYEILPGKIKDCISIPKTNGYSSLHTTIKDKKNDSLQIKIRTKEIDNKDMLGVMSYWQTNQNSPHFFMQQELEKEFQFYQTLLQLNQWLIDDRDFVSQAKLEILSKMIYPKTKEGKAIELPNGATIIDFLSRLETPVNQKEIVLVNGFVRTLGYNLNNNDIVQVVKVPEQQILTPNNLRPITTSGKRKVMQIYK